MSYRGPKVKKSRRLGVAISTKAQRYLERRPGPPGMHNRGRRPNKMSDFGRQLMEKQRLRFQYNISEKQLRSNYKEADRRPGSTPDILLHLLEARLDALVLRSGFARSIHAARQYVRHGHFTVNGQRVNIPSYRISVGDVIAVREKSKQMDCFAYALSTSERVPYITTDEAKMSIVLNRLPEREEVPVICDVPVVVEFYSR